MVSTTSAENFCRNPILLKIRRVLGLLHDKSYEGVKRPLTGVMLKSPLRPYPTKALTNKEGKETKLPSTKEVHPGREESTSRVPEPGSHRLGHQGVHSPHHQAPRGTINFLQPIFKKLILRCFLTFIS
ncbi:hypothetical protein AVEN_118284-1 [Araneus ventricosus]|uniref:Uncharacterized protein n=1 Tax=Araneus ventricosus TaxID=182803 RepID=A0A4Y2E147_ARAVE|nr:hypothetical protein AVEN_118284-1 [Araneus ventricosus]